MLQPGGEKPIDKGFSIAIDRFRVHLTVVLVTPSDEGPGWAVAERVPDAPPVPLVVVEAEGESVATVITEIEAPAAGHAVTVSIDTSGCSGSSFIDFFFFFL